MLTCSDLYLVTSLLSPKVPPSTFCDIWVRDEEYVNNQCVALAAYAASCHKFNVCTEWRRPDRCRKSSTVTIQSATATNYDVNQGWAVI